MATTSLNPVSTGGAVTPLSAPFSYNFAAAVSGTYVDVDLTDSIPAGTYTVSGVANTKKQPRRVQLLNASGTIVGSATTTYSGGSWTSVNNSATYTCTITTTQAFTKVRFLGSLEGSVVYFPSTAPTGAYHLLISPGTRTLTDVSLFDTMATQTGATVYTNHPTAVPEGNLLHSWVFGGKYYVMTGSVGSSSVPTSGTLNNIKVFAWNYATSTWSASLATTRTPTTIGLNNYAVLMTTNGSVADYQFKNGKIVIKFSSIKNADAQTTISTPSGAWIFDSVNNTLTGLNAGTTLLNPGAAAYNPTNDEWYILSGLISNGGGTYSTSSISKLTNTVSIDSMVVNPLAFPAVGDYGGTLEIYCEDAASPKVLAMAGDSSGQLYLFAINSGGWSSGGVVNREFGTGTVISSTTTFGPQIGNNVFNSGRKSVATTLGNYSQIVSIDPTSTSCRAYGGPHTWFSTASAIVSGITDSGYQTKEFLNYDIRPDIAVSPQTARLNLGPISSTQYGMCIRQWDVTTGYTWSAYTFALPHTSPLHPVSI